MSIQANDKKFNNCYNLNNFLVFHSVQVSQKAITNNSIHQEQTISNKVVQEGNNIILEMTMIQNGQKYTMKNKLELCDKATQPIESFLTQLSETAKTITQRGSTYENKQYENNQSNRQSARKLQQQQPHNYASYTLNEYSFEKEQPTTNNNTNENNVNSATQSTEKELPLQQQQQNCQQILSAKSEKFKSVSTPEIEIEDQSTISSEKQETLEQDQQTSINQQFNQQNQQEQETNQKNNIKETKQYQQKTIITGKSHKSGNKKSSKKAKSTTDIRDDDFFDQTGEESSSISLQLTPTKQLNIEELKAFGIFTNRKNAVKNIVKAFHRFLCAPYHESEIIEDSDICGSNKDLKVLRDLRKIMTRLERKRKYNQQLIYTIYNQDKLNYAFRLFLRNHAMQWLRDSKIQEQDIYSQVLRDYSKLFNEL